MKVSALLGSRRRFRWALLLLGHIESISRSRTRLGRTSKQQLHGLSVRRRRPAHFQVAVALRRVEVALGEAFNVQDVDDMACTATAYPRIARCLSAIEVGVSYSHDFFPAQVWEHPRHEWVERKSDRTTRPAGH